MSPASALAGTAAAAAIAVVALLVMSCSSKAHDENATIGDVRVDQVAATPARAGETTRITLSVENGGAERVVVTGVRLPTGEPSRVVGFYGTSHSGAVGGIPVDPGETARLDGRSAWIEVGPLKTAFSPGSIVAARLVLNAYEAPLSLHVLTSNAAASPQAGVAPSPPAPNPSVPSSWWHGFAC